jgi:ribosomal RNA assembly protein
MNTIYFPKLQELKMHQEELEEKLNVSLSIKGKQVTYEGEAVDEYEAELVLQAMAFGFSYKKAIQLLETDMAYKVIGMKQFTKRKDMEEVRSRVIGKEGKTKRIIEHITDCDIIINGNDIGIIGPSLQVEAAIVGLGNLIRGTKEANTYAYLERHNTDTKRNRSDLGLREDEEKGKNRRENEGDEDDVE